MPRRALRLACAAALTASTASAQPDPTAIDWVALDGFHIARTEATVAQFRRFAEATGLVTRVTQTPAGVNGLHDMGGNVWDWVDEPRSASGDAASSASGRGSGNPERRTRGGSWWHGAAQMRADPLQSKPADTAVVYIGFRCLRPR